MLTVFDQIVFIAMVFGAFVMWSWWPVIVGIVVILGASYLLQWFSPLVVVTRDASLRQRRWSLLLGGVLLLIVAIEVSSFL